MKVAPLVIFLAGCAPSALAPPSDLLDAQRALARAAASPFAEEVIPEIAEAEKALTQAERDMATRPSSARAADSAYVALRAAEKAVIAGRYAAERTALEKARTMAARLSEDLDRREAFFENLARRRAAREEAQAKLREAHRAALAKAAHLAGARVIEQPEAFVFRLAAEQLFLPGTSLFRDGAPDRLWALCNCLLRWPPFAIRISILCDADGFKTPPNVLHQRRVRRVHDTLRAFGMPEDVILPGDRTAPPGAQVDVVVIEPELPLPSE